MVAIGRERLRQILHERGISFQRTRTWRQSTDPERDAKLDRIEYVTSAYADRCFAFDQFGPLSIRPCHGTCWAPRKHPVRLRATYHRTHGIRYFHGCYSLGDDQLWGVTREHKGAGHTLAALKSIRAARPGGYRLFVILDNLAANKTPAIRRWAKRENVELCLTPTSSTRELDRLVLALVHLEELFRGRAHRNVPRLEPFPQTGRAIGVDLDEGRELRFGPDHFFALANDPAPYPDHACVSTRTNINNRGAATYLGQFADSVAGRPRGPRAGCRAG